MDGATFSIETFLKLDAIKGESLDGDTPGHGERGHHHKHHHRHGEHTDEIAVTEWDWGVGNPAPLKLKSKEATKQTKAHDLTIIKGIDKASPILMKYCALGWRIPNGKLTCRKNAGEEKIEFLVIELTDIKVMSVKWDRGDGGRSETVKLQLSKFKVHYKQQRNSGAANTGVVDFGFDLPNHTQF
jgi:type VI secretion system secreted protein Hcp